MSKAIARRLPGGCAPIVPTLHNLEPNIVVA